MLYPRSLESLIDSFKMFPGIGEKTAERLAFCVLGFEDDEVITISNNLLDVKKNVKNCSLCGCLSDDDVCPICSDGTRNKQELIVVEGAKDIFSFEKLGIFNGYYHVLGGLISPLNDMGPDDIAVASLLDRIKKNDVKEVILAIKSGIEADMTCLYIKKILDKDNIVVTRIASGIPIGADMDYVDALTLESALKNRKEVL